MHRRQKAESHRYASAVAMLTRSDELWRPFGSLRQYLSARVRDLFEESGSLIGRGQNFASWFRILRGCSCPKTSVGELCQLCVVREENRNGIFARVLVRPLTPQKLRDGQSSAATG